MDLDYWNASIMGNSEALRYMMDIHDSCRIKMPWTKDPEWAIKAFSRYPAEETMRYVTRSKNPGLLAQVLVLMHMAVGAMIPAGIGDIALAACEKEESDPSDWVEHAAERVTMLREFADLIKNYDGTPVKPSEGKRLFEVMCEKDDGVW